MRCVIVLSLQYLEYEVTKVINKHKSQSISSNLTRNHRETLAHLRARNRTSVSDKVSEFVVVDINVDNKLMEKHLGNETPNSKMLY